MLPLLFLLLGPSGGYATDYEIFIVAGDAHTVAMKADGTFETAGDPSDNRIDVSGWEQEDIIQIAAGDAHTVALRSNGTVTAEGKDNRNQKSGVDDATWSNIDYIAAGNLKTVGWNLDGKVVFAGDDSYQQDEITAWETTDPDQKIVQIAVGGFHIVGLKANGGVVAKGRDNYGQKSGPESWSNIKQVIAGRLTTIGWKNDGGFETAGDNANGQLNLTGWDTQDEDQKIVQIVAGGHHTVGLRANGTVVAVGLNSSGQCDVTGWTDIENIAAGLAHTVAMKKDGTVVATGLDTDDQCDVEDWVLKVFPGVSFEASAQEIDLDNSVTLNWTTTNAQRVIIENVIDTTTDLNGDVTVQPKLAVTTYTLTAEGYGETATQSITIAVNGGYERDGQLTIDGKIGIGTPNPQSELAVNGVITAKEVIVTLTGWPDYVFDEKYDLPSLGAVASYIRGKGHLPDIPPARQIAQDGLKVTEILSRQMQKIEELTLYVIQLDKDNRALRSRITALEENQ